MPEIKLTDISLKDVHLTARVSGLRKSTFSENRSAKWVF
jgi:hypothetical protein